MNRQLTIIVTGDSPQEWGPLEIESMSSVQIGRDPGCDLVLNHEWVSRRHCRIFQEQGRVWIEDQGSKDGTVLNGKRLSGRRILHDGDEIGIGDVVLEVAISPHGAARAVQRGAGDGLTWDATVVGSTRVAETAESVGAIALTGDLLTIGRDPGCGCSLAHPMLSWRHARLRKEHEEWFLEDLLSANGTFVNGQRVKQPRRIVPGDVISLGPLRLTFEGSQLVPRASAEGVRVCVRGLSKEVTDRQSGKPLWLLNGIELTIEPREFVGLLGGSGCGKSTFMDTLNGRRPATQGAVLYDGENLYERFEALKSTIGYVPQDVIFHDRLPLAHALRYSAQLRLPGDTTAEEMEGNIDRVLRTVGLLERRATLIQDLSGGQKKRVSIAMELLSGPQVLFLDEVTSGLDLGTEQQMMQLFRTLADDGMTIVCITHHVDSLKMTDIVAYFVKGRLAFFGPPDALREHFGIEEIRDIYGAEAKFSPEQWEERFKASPAFNVFVRFRSKRDDFSAGMARENAGALAAGRRGHFMRQWRVLTARYVKLLTVEYRNVLLLVGLAPGVAAMLCIVAGSISVVSHPATMEELRMAGSKQNLLCFGASINVFFLAIFGSVREIVKENPIFRHERFINLQIVPYFLSKALPLMVIGIVEVLLVTAVLQVFGGMHAGGAGFEIVILSLVSMVGTLMGLAISAGAPTPDWAIICMIAVVIPEILFSGALVPARGISGTISKALIGIYWAQRALLGQLDDATRHAIAGSPEAGQTMVSAVVLCVQGVVMGLAAVLFLMAKDYYGPVAWVVGRLREMVFRGGRRA